MSFKHINILLIFTLFLCLDSCCSCRKGSPIIGNLEETVWTIVEINECKIEAPVIKISFDKSSKVLKGTSETGEIWAGYHLYEKKEGNIEFLNPGSNSNSALLDSFVKTLEETKTVKIDNGHLLMLDNQSNIIAILYGEK